MRCSEKERNVAGDLPAREVLRFRFSENVQLGGIMIDLSCPINFRGR